MSMVSYDNMVPPPVTIADLVAQMKGFEASDDARQKLFAHLLQKYSELVNIHEDLKNDYASERDMRRNYQKTVEHIQRQVTEKQRELDDHSFVLALIDGDGVIFQDALLQAAANDGGSEAASRLQQAVREHIASLYGNSGNWPIMVQIYLSLDKLAQKLVSVGLLQKPQDMRTFAQGFALNQSLFTIVDVGYGKERADHKIKEMLRTFSENPTCRHIVFGGCHDAGYLLSLDQYKHNELKASRITLLESTPAWRGFLDLPFVRVNFDSVFRNTPLPEYTAPAYQHGSLPGVGSAPHQALQPIVRSMTTPLTNTPPPSGFGHPAPPPGLPHPPNGTPALSSPTTTISSRAAAATPDSAETSWATVGKTGVPPNENISIAPPKKSNKVWVYYNEEEMRLDEPLPPRDKAAAEAIETRMKKTGRNLCNHFHLGKGKCLNYNCGFQHEPKLTAAEANALRYKARSLPCKDRYCTNFNCYLGHQCSFERDTGYCPFPDTCNLRNTHGMDRVKFSRWDEHNNEERL